MKSMALPLMLILATCGLVAIAAAAGTNTVQKAGVAAGETPPAAPPKPAPSPPAPGPAGPLARWIGQWDVQYSNGIHEVHELRDDRSVTVKVAALNYATKGYIGFDGKRVTIVRDGGGIERWTPVGDRMVVEYWDPSSHLQTKPALLCIGEHPPKDAPAVVRYTDRSRGFRLTLPKDWSVAPASYSVVHYRDVFLCINSKGNNALRVGQDMRLGYDDEAVAKQLSPGTAYIDVAIFDGPGGGRNYRGAPDTVGSDLKPLLKSFKPVKAAGGKLSIGALTFVKREHQWSIYVYLREPVKEEVRRMAWKVLRSFEFPAALPPGKWNVEFANGVKQMCQVDKKGTVSVTESRRTSTGKAEAKDGSVVISYKDGRVERWTPVGERMVVEHWPSSLRFPSGRSVLGIAEVAR